MKEDFIQFIWESQQFDKRDLLTSQSEQINIINPGNKNLNSGPDFQNVNIKLSNVDWYGQIEVHVNSSDWYKHKHEKNSAYKNVILHVVWNDDKIIKHDDGTQIPTLELKHKVNPSLIENFNKLVNTKHTIACRNQIQDVDEIAVLTILQRALFQRLTNKNNLVYKLLNSNNGNWEEVAYRLLAYNFGFKVNIDPFFELSSSIPFSILKKNFDSITQIESILFGQAGMLKKEVSKCRYYKELHNNYQYLKHKYSFKESSLTESQWKFFRLRPANFPTIRIAQFAKLLYKNKSIFDLIINNSVENINKKLNIKQSSYWTKHYKFLKNSKVEIPGLGKSSIENILINTFIPILVAYGKYKDEQKYIDRAIQILQKLPSEENRIIKEWRSLGQKIRSSFDSQGYIELYNNFCSLKKCLSCNIGANILKRRVEINAESLKHN